MKPGSNPDTLGLRVAASVRWALGSGPPVILDEEGRKAGRDERINSLFSCGLSRGGGICCTVGEQPPVILDEEGRNLGPSTIPCSVPLTYQLYRDLACVASALQ